MKFLFLLLKAKREQFLDRYHDKWQAKFFSSLTWSLWQISAQVLRRYGQGKVLDAGCGRGGWKKPIEDAGCTYFSTDASQKGQFNPTWIGSLENLPQIESESFDTIICHQVLEHIRDTNAALKELNRLLKPKGCLIISVPHLSRYHELPHDYYRFTAFGLKAVCEKAGFKRNEILNYGGLLGFLHHQLSTVVPGLLMGIPVISHLAFFLNAGLAIPLNVIDRHTNQLLFPAGIVGVFTKIK